MEIRRGDIYYIDRIETVGCEQRAGRPAIVVSNNANNTFSKTIEVVYLTCRTKRALPTHVEIYSAVNPSTALCEQVSTVSVDRIQRYIGKCTQREMELINSAVAISLGIN